MWPRGRLPLDRRCWPDNGQLRPAAPLFPRAIVEANVIAEHPPQEVEHARLHPDVAVGHHLIAGVRARVVEHRAQGVGVPQAALFAKDARGREAVGAGYVPCARPGARFHSVEGLGRSGIEERDARLFQVCPHPLGVHDDVGLRMRRECARNDTGELFGQWASVGAPGSETAVQQRCPVAEAEVIQGEEDPRRGRREFAVRAQHDPAPVRHAHLLEGRLEFRHGRQLQRQPLAARR
jgi:hypothetical protein